jgi:hypothetical protein
MTTHLYLTQVALEKGSRAITIQRFENDPPDNKQGKQEAGP